MTYYARTLYPQSSITNIWKYSSNPTISGVKIYESTGVHSVELDWEPDLGPGSAAQFLNSSINSPVDDNGIILQYTTAGIKNLKLNFDVAFSPIAYSPVGSGGARTPHNLAGPYVALDVRGSGLKVSTDYPSGYISNPYLQFKYSVNPTLISEDIVICSSLYYPTSSTTFEWPNSTFENSRMYMEVADNYTKINQAVPECMPSLSGNLSLWYPDEFKISEINLFFYGTEVTYSGTIPLFTVGAVPHETGVPLYLRNQVIPSGVDLYLQNSTSFNSVDLYINGLDYNDKSLDLYLLSDSNFDAVNLTTYGQDTYADGVTLFTLAGAKYDTVNLFEYGSQPVNDNISLYTLASAKYDTVSLFQYGQDAYASGVTLFTHGSTSYNSGIPLYTLGNETQTNGITLHTGQDEPIFFGSFSSKSVPLWTYSESNSALFGTKTLYLEHQSWYPDPRYRVNLHTRGPDNISVNDSLNLFTYYDNTQSIASGVQLFLKNGWAQSVSGIALNTYAQNTDGDGGENSIPYKDNINLFMSRDANSHVDNMPLFVKSYDASSGNASLYVFGAYSANSGLNFFTKSNLNTSSVKLYSHGF